MRKSKFSPERIAKILKEFEGGKSAQEICREYGVSTATFNNLLPLLSKVTAQVNLFVDSLFFFNFQSNL